MSAPILWIAVAHEAHSFNSDTGIRIHVANLTDGVAGVTKTIDYSVSKDAVGHLVDGMSITDSRLAVVMDVSVNTPLVQELERHLVVWDRPSSRVIVVRRYSSYFDDDQQHSSIHTEVFGCHRL